MLNLSHVFTALGRAGRNRYLINTAQAAQGTPFTTLSGLSYINPAWIANLAQGYDSGIRSETGGMSVWQQAAQTILQQLVAADNPVFGQSLPAALNYLYQQMIAQSASVQQYTIGSSYAAASGNVGAGSLLLVTIRGDGLILQNTVAETGEVLITSDSFTGNATVGQEPWSWTGAPNTSSYGTGTAVGVWDFDNAVGSGSSAGGTSIAANQYANTSGNLLTNGDFATWVGSPAVPNNWNLVTGTWGTSIQQTTGMTASTFAVQFNAGATLNKMTTQFGAASTTTGATAGTIAALTAYQGYGFNVYLKATGVVTAGTLVVSLVDGTGTVINDQSGNANTATISLSGLSSSAWTAEPIAFRLPVVLPSTIRLQVAEGVAISGANVLFAWSSFAQQGGGLVNLYAGGPNLAVFSRPDLPFEATPEPDGWAVTFTNNYGGSTYRASWQSLINLLFQTPSLILPYSNAPTILDSLITAP